MKNMILKSMVLSAGRRDPLSSIALKRRWRTRTGNEGVATSLAGNSSTVRPKANFSVCSYNTLCPETLLTTPYLYTNCPSEWLDWDFRWNLIKLEISNMDADIYCLQEVNEKFNESHFKPFFDKQGFTGAFKKRTGSKPDGCAIYWRNSKFLVEMVDFVEYQIPKTFLDRDNVGIVVRLVPLWGNQAEVEKRLVVANTHLLFNPGRGDIKLCQLALFLARIRKSATKSRQRPDQSQQFPVIICGDFNATPNSPLYNLMVQGELYYHGIKRGDVTGQQRKGGPQMVAPILPASCGVDENCEISDDKAAVRLTHRQTLTSTGFMRHGLGLKSAYSHKTKRNKPEVSTYHCNDASNVDYIFYSGGVMGDAEQNPTNSAGLGAEIGGVAIFHADVVALALAVDPSRSELI